MVDIEKELLHAVALSPKKFTETSININKDDFMNESHKIVFECLKNTLDVHGDLKREFIINTLVSIGKYSECKSIVDDITLTTSASVFIKPLYSMIKEASSKRNLKQFYHAILKDIDSNKKSSELIIETLENIEKYLIHSKDQVHDCKLMSDYAPSDIEYIPTGFNSIDSVIEGFERGNLAIFGARTGIGKSRFAMQIAENVSRKLPVLFFSLEMPARQLKYNLLSQVTGIYSDKIKRGNLNLVEREKVENAIKYCRTLNLEFVDSVMNIDDIISLIKSRCMQKEYGLIVIDYIQLVTGSSKESRHLEISEIAKKLKRCAIKNNIPIFCPAQLGRQVEMNKTKEPSKHDLKESGSLEEDADLIFFIWKINDDIMNKDVYFKCEKNRNNGRFVKTELKFDNQKISFVDSIETVKDDNIQKPLYHTG